MADDDKRGLFSRIFLAMMMLCALFWLWTVAFILAWPWTQTADWKAEYRLAATCADAQPCGQPYGSLAAARAEGRIASLLPPSGNGEIMEEDAWLRWKKVSGQPWQVEATASSWHFQTGLRYRIEGDAPVLVAVQDIGAQTVYYGLGAALLTFAAIYLRKLRRR